MDLLPEVQDSNLSVEIVDDNSIDENLIDEEQVEALPEITEKEKIQVDEVFKKAEALPAVPKLQKIKKKRTMTPQAKESLAKARAKALETRKRNAELRKEGKLKTKKQIEEDKIKKEIEDRKPVINNITHETKHITNNITEEDIMRIALETSSKATQKVLQDYEEVRKQRKEVKRKKKEAEQHRTLVKNKINTALGYNRNDTNFYDSCF
tara:strand:- start:1294 stop:1920 length:627 start_codon:yes stop_codon:yes gene_type:complete